YRRSCCPFTFFFSSRRRHTRFSRDWSSDVCSSDLIAAAVREITGLNEEMENAANEQSDVSESINQNVIEISRSAEQTSGDAQETARIAGDLLAMAETLRKTVEQFRLSQK